MNIKLICILLMLSVSFAAFGQQKIKFHSLNMVGFAAGKSGKFAILQTVNGLQYKKLFAGIGTGIDYYKNKTIPLFFDIRTTIAKTNIYAFGDIGYNFSSNDDLGKEVFYSSNHFFGGLYNELGMGYKIQLAKKKFLLLSSGYSYKELTEKVSTVNECLVAPCTVDYSRYQYAYGRIVFKAGFLF